MRNTWGCWVLVCFSRSAPPSGSLEERRRAHQKEASKLSLDFSCQWQGGCGGLDSSDLPLSPVQRWDWQPWGWGGAISRCVCPRLDLRKGGLTWRRGEEATLVEQRRSAAAQLSRAEKRGAVRERRLTIRQLEERTLTNPYGCLRNNDQSPLPPLFSFSGTFGFEHCPEKSLASLKLFSPGCNNNSNNKKQRKVNPLVVDVPGGHGYPYKMESKTEDNWRPHHFSGDSPFCHVANEFR